LRRLLLRSKAGYLFEVHDRTFQWTAIISRAFAVLKFQFSILKVTAKRLKVLIITGLEKEKSRGVIAEHRLQ
jgi:hypothetical protein